MNAAINKAAIIGSTDFDEETWLMEPPSLPAQSDGAQGSGRIIEWLQGATMNVDFQTRSALSRKLASQAAKKKKRAEKLLEKAASVGHSPTHLARVQEELAEISLSGDGEEGREEDVEGVGVAAAAHTWNGSRAVDSRKLAKHLEVLYENEQQQQQQQLGAVGSAPQRGRTATMTSEEDENDEFYDASSDFNESPRTPLTSNSANVIASQPAAAHESRDKLILNGSPLAAVSECAELSTDSKVSSTSSSGLRDDARYFRQANTARVPPTVIQQSVSPRSPRLEKSASLFASPKSHSPSAQPDLNDIRSIVERQETELREELSRLKSNIQGENGKTSSPRTRAGSQVQSARPATALASSRSVEFGAKLSPLAAPSPVSHTSRLPTPIRKNVGRSMIPTPRSSLLTRSAVRGLAGGSTPSLAVPSQHLSDETRSECGGISRNEQRWADECF